MTLRCNICSQDIDEKDVETHINSKQHLENKSKIPIINSKAFDNSVVEIWQKSLNE